MATITSSNAENVAEPVTDRHSLLQTIVLHILPGLVIALFYAMTAAMLRSSGWPSIMALTLVGLVVLTPLLLAIVYWQAQKYGRNGRSEVTQNHQVSLLTRLPGLSSTVNQRVLPYQQKTPFVQAVLLVLGSILLAGAGMSALKGITQALMQSFSWLPTSFFLTEDISVYPQPVLLTTAVLNILVIGLLAPWAEEIYFRGYLLPRISWMKGWSPVLGATLFTLYHFWTPWLFFGRFLAVLPMAAVVYWKKDLRLGIWIHCLVNLIDGISLLVLAIG